MAHFCAEVRLNYLWNNNILEQTLSCCVGFKRCWIGHFLLHNYFVPSIFSTTVQLFDPCRILVLPFGAMVAKGEDAVTEVIHSFPVLTALSEPSWCWVSIQAAGLGCFVVFFSPLWKRIVELRPWVPFNRKVPVRDGTNTQLAWEQLRDQCKEVLVVNELTGAGWTTFDWFKSQRVLCGMEQLSCRGLRHNFSLTPTVEVAHFRKALTVCWLGLFVRLTDLLFLDVGRTQGWNGFLLFCLATQLMENSSVVGFAWRSRAVVFGGLHKKMRLEQIPQALKPICQTYKQQPVFIYSIWSFSKYSDSLTLTSLL